MKERKKKIARMLKKGLVCSMVGVMMLSMVACGSTGKKTETNKQKSEEKKAKEAEEAARKAEEEKKAKEEAEAAKQQAGTNASQNQGKVEGADKKEDR